MLKNLIGNISSRLLRAAVGRMTTDIELLRTIQACTSSAALVDLLMTDAQACSSRLEVMHAAFNVRASGFICELGVYRGDSSNEIARKCPHEIIYGFDTFAGLPEFWRDGFPKGTFDVSSEKIIFEKNCILYKGLFDETLPKFLKEVQGQAGLVHIDCDIYSSSISALLLLAPRISIGTVIIFDEYFNYTGWQKHEFKAFQEFLDSTGLGCKYIAYNKLGQQVAAIITSRTQ